MFYLGVPKEKTKEMDICVSKIMKNSGKNKTTAISICKTAILNKKQEKKEKPYEVVADNDSNYLFFSKSKINSVNNGKLVKNIEIFKAGTFKGVQFKKIALDKMAANFHYLKAFNIVPHVPVRADHPSGGFFGGGDVIDKVGGYITDLRRIGNKLVADIRVTDSKMLKKILDGTYINRSSEIGTYVDNDGQIFSPTLLGFAWVDLPAVEKLSPTFSFSKKLNRSLISLNDINMSKKKIVKKRLKEKKVVLKKEVKSFEELFPKEAKELSRLRDKQIDNYLDKLIEGGKVLPAMKELEISFIKGLSKTQLKEYKKLNKKRPALVDLNNNSIGAENTVKPKKSEKKSFDKEAEKFLKETN